MGFTQSFYLRTRASGLPKITLRVFVNRARREISTGFSALPDNWDTKQCRLKKTAPNYELGNFEIDKLKTHGHRVFMKLQAIENPSIADFDDLFFGKAEAGGDFYVWAEAEIQKMKPDISIGTFRHYVAVISKLKKFRPAFQFKDFNPDFVIEYRNHMVSDLKNMVNTVNSNFKKLKRLVVLAMQQGKINENPFRYYKSKKANTNRVFLSLDELNKIEDLFYNSEFSGGVENVTRNFLFCCFTGLRYGDLSDLTWNEIKTDHLELLMNKTNDYIRIPLIERAAKLLPERDGNKIFRVPSNQVTNRFLKEMAEQAKIEKEITSHVARHTFATMGITLGIPIEVISKLLGHTDIKTTQVYAKIIDQVKDREMQKMNNTRNP